MKYSQVFCWFECSSCKPGVIDIFILLQANEGDESDDDDGMLCECPSCTKSPLSLSLTS
jgi:hypothetical protein